MTYMWCDIVSYRMGCLGDATLADEAGSAGERIGQEAVPSGLAFAANRTNGTALLATTTISR
jgi:hypothetical protein